MAKRRTEHKTVHMEMPGPDWGDDMKRIERCCDDMQGKGWALLTMSWPDMKNAVLMFTRPSVKGLPG